METTVEEQNEAEIAANYPGSEEARPKNGGYMEPLNAPWDEMKDAVEKHGMTLLQVSEQFGVSHDAVKQRASRHEWLTPKRLAELLAKRRTAEMERASLAVTQGGVVVKCAPDAIQAVSDTFERHRSTTLLGLAKLAGKGIERAISANLEVENWQDAKIVADIAMKLHNVGQEGVNVNVLVGGDGGFDGPTISISDEMEDDETGEDD